MLGSVVRDALMTCLARVCVIPNSPTFLFLNGCQSPVWLDLDVAADYAALDHPH